MRHARSDYDAIQPWPTKRPHYAKQNGRTVIVPVDHDSEADVATQLASGFIQPIIPDDEPVFLIRGQDPASIPAVEAWCAEAEKIGADESIIATVRRHIELMRQWQAAHPTKIPDAPDGTLR